jgi:hypothetical protein
MIADVHLLTPTGGVRAVAAGQRQFALVGCGEPGGGLAEFERELIKARTGEGRARAKAQGVHMGRPPKLTPHQKREPR